MDISFVPESHLNFRSIQTKEDHRGFALETMKWTTPVRSRISCQFQTPFHIQLDDKNSSGLQASTSTSPLRPVEY
ncbi:hypothetical protein Y1Q_0009129 [Alligator mississippiensis]|uniref:Uncharacterized protein n=1 Tax=Alligator mississippiensis TaxID=8496 RepID=A0A151M2D9_ALLMI|nr:hypothetical protein Y1Q_0009129 [Alligator mississippiensis]